MRLFRYAPAVLCFVGILIDFALSSAHLNASTELMSGLQASFYPNLVQARTILSPISFPSISFTVVPVFAATLPAATVTLAICR